MAAFDMSDGVMDLKSRLAALGCLVLATALGCGSSDRVVVRGELHQKGERYRPADGEQVTISFGEWQNGSLTGEVYPTRLAPDGTFRITGPDGTGIRPGAYRVGITSMPEVPLPGKPPTDKFGGAFDLAKTPVSVEVVPSNDSVTLEIP